MDKDELKAKIVIAQSGCIRTRNELVLANMGLVHKVVSRYKKNKDDLLQEGVLGLMRAVDLYDTERGFAFSTYAIRWIYYYVVEAMSFCKAPVYIPRSAGRTTGTRARWDHEVWHPDTFVAYEGAEDGWDAVSSSTFPLAELVEKIDIERIMPALTPREAVILESLLQGNNLSETGKGMGLSRERIRQVKEAMLDRITENRARAA